MERFHRKLVEVMDPDDLEGTPKSPVTGVDDPDANC